MKALKDLISKYESGGDEYKLDSFLLELKRLASAERKCDTCRHRKKWMVSAECGNCVWKLTDNWEGK